MRHKLRSLQAVMGENQENIIGTINHFRRIIRLANQKLAQLNIHYFDHLKIVYFDHHKIIFETDIPEMVGKVRELEDKFITLLRQDIFFKSLSEIKTQFKPTIREAQDKQTSENNDQHLLEIFTEQQDKIQNPQLKQKLQQIIEKRKNDQ